MKQIKYRIIKFFLKFVSNSNSGKCYNCNEKTDLETLIYFEEMISKSYGNRCETLHFLMYNPSEDIKTQLELIMSDPDFVRWTFI